jgi:hypothetical protein
VPLADKLMRHGVDTLPHVCNMYPKQTWCLLWARRQNLSHLRVEKLGCAGSRAQVIPAVYRLLRLRVGHQVGPAVILEASTGMPASVSSRPDLTDSQSPAYTYLKRHWWPLQPLNIRFGLAKSLASRGKLFLPRNSSLRHFNEPMPSELNRLDVPTLVRGLRVVVGPCL